MNNVLIGGEGWVYYETIAGGEGGQPHRAGMSGVHTAMTNSKNTPIEALERSLPAAGAALPPARGQRRRRPVPGGDGHRARPPGARGLHRSASSPNAGSASRPGLAGGGPGAVGENWVLPGGFERLAKRLPDKCTVQLKAGDVLRMLTPGGGGWGPSNPW